MPKIDFSDVRQMEAMPAGDYRATLTEATYVEKAQSSGKPYVKLVFTISEDGPYSGRKLFRNLSLQPEALWAYKQSMIALGTDPEEFDGELDPEETAKERMGQEAVLSVSQKPDNRDPERMSNNVDRIRELSFA